MRRRGPRAAILLAALSTAGLAAAPIPWEDMTEADWIHALATRQSVVEGHRVHYPTPTAELRAALEARSDPAALRHLAEARREMGDWEGAVAALEAWATAEGPEAWAEAARWGTTHLRMDLAFRAAERALTGLSPEAKRDLAGERVTWAVAHPDQADALALRRVRSEMFPDDGAALEDWLRALEAAGRFDEAEAALAGAAALPPERRLLLRSDLLAAHDRHGQAFEVLDAALDSGEPRSLDFRRAYRERTDRGSPGAPEAWRAELERAFSPRALLRLATYFQGQGRGDAAADLLRQVERRYEHGFDRQGWLLLSRLHGEIDAVPEAFRAGLAASQKATPEEQAGDLPHLVRFALRAGGRPLAWGAYNDEPYRWVARVDRTPGFWTGGVSFLLTGMDFKEALAHLESESRADRTFATARVLAAELARRSPSHAALPGLRVAIMERHVERGEGKDALALLPQVEASDPATADEGRRVALLAVRQVEVPVAEELRLFRARLRRLAPDGSKPEPEPLMHQRSPPPPVGRDRVGVDKGPSYRDVLEEAVSRLDHRDASHRTSLDLLLSEMDRMPEAEDLWSDLATRLEGWSLDDELGPRYERALERFKGEGWWARLARWYARRERHLDLERLAGEIATRFRGAEVFSRAAGADVMVEVPEQPRVGGSVRLVAFADWVRLKALERFPHSPKVFAEARGRLLARSLWEKEARGPRGAKGARRTIAREDRMPVAEDSFLEERRWALLFADEGIREEHFAERMRKRTLQAALVELEGRADRTPVEDRLLFEGWARLSRFERAAPAADRLAAAYPGDAGLARRVLSLHRSLAGLDPSHAAPARAVVERTAPALLDPNPLWTELGELEEERGRPEAALAEWRKILDRDPRSPDRVSELATLLWDYGHMAEALAVVEEGRKRLSRPRFFAFETGVLREEVRDVEGAIREYLAALWPEAGACCAYYERDQRSLRRLAQLLGRERVLRLVLARTETLEPGVRGDEETLASILPIAPMIVPEPGLDWTVDDWIDGMDLPRDPVGRAERAEAMAAARPGQHEGIERLTTALLEKSLAMARQATRTEFVDAVEGWSGPLVESRFARERAVLFKDALLARRAELAPTEEGRIAKDVERARFLAESGMTAQADTVWTALAGRIGALPEGAPRMRALAERAAYLERTRGVEAAAEEWRGLEVLYPWSLGVLEDRLAFLNRVGCGEEARAALEAVVPRAAPGHREGLLERLTRESLEAKDLARARRAVDRLLREPLEEDRRLAAVHLLARLSWRENAGFDPLPLAKAEAEKLKAERHADLYERLALAADAEARWPAAVTLWIEALNRRTERSWLGQACRSAGQAGRLPDLLGFFEKQRARSPRDVRWAVAVRDIKRHAHDVPGTIEAAKAAVAVRPEREDLWREAADLLVRTDRVREAADYIEGWNRPRPADEGVATWRGELYARADDGARALAIEQAALAAYTRDAPLDEARKTELRERTARAARRLRDYGHPRLAWSLAAPGGVLTKLSATALGDRELAELALQTGNFLRLLRHRAMDEAFRTAAAEALRDHGRPEAKDEVQAWLLARLVPATGPAPPSTAALETWWPFVETARMEEHVRLAVAERLAASVPGPWQAEAPLPFLESVGQAVVSREPREGRLIVVFKEVPMDGLWARDLVRRDRGSDLYAFLDTRWDDLLARVRAATPLPAPRERLAWARWLDDETVLLAWARAAADRPEAVAELAAAFSARRSWDLLWALAASGWKVAPLVAILPAEARTAWFRFWETAPAVGGPVFAARRKAVEEVSLAVGRLVAGAPGSAADPLVVKLRGPRTIGDVLGRDAAWTWAEFLPRVDVAGRNIETGDDRVIGQRSDTGRLPGALWGERPGEAWYVLETLARFRESAADAPRIPLEVPERARAAERGLLAVRLAESLGDVPLALELDEAAPGADARLEMRLRLLVKAGQRDRAEAVFAEHVRRLQPSLTEARFRALEPLAQELALPAPLELLDRAVPVAPGFLAYLFDRRGADAAAAFTTADAFGFRSALASRWASRPRALAPAQVRYWLTELWASGAGTLPRAALPRLGGIWPHAGDWLERQRPTDRAAVLLALGALPEIAPFEALVARGPADDVTGLLAARIHLARGDEALALALVDAMIAGLGQAPLRFEAAAEEPPPEGDEAAWEDEEGGSDETRESAAEDTTGRDDLAADPLAARLVAWLAPFREAKRAEPVEARIRSVLAERRRSGPVPVASWRLALELTPAAEKAALLGDIERAWFRGDWEPEQLAPLVEALADLAPEEAPRWLARWPRTTPYDAVARRALALARIKDREGAAAVLVTGRARGLWTSAEEVQAFDAWRRVAAPAAASTSPKPPAAWARAVAFWTMKPAEVDKGLGPHLRAHPHDVLAARVVLRTADPAGEEPLRRAAAALRDPVMESVGDPASDDAFLRLRIARGLLPSSWRAARTALEGFDVPGLARDLARRRLGRAATDAALADVGRIAGRSGDAAAGERVLAVLSDRKSKAVGALRAELRELAKPEGPPQAFRVVSGRPAPYRPRDLDWPVLAAVLAAEGSR